MAKKLIFSIVGILLLISIVYAGFQFSIFGSVELENRPPGMVPIHQQELHTIPGLEERADHVWESPIYTMWTRGSNQVVDTNTAPFSIDSSGRMYTGYNSGGCCPSSIGSKHLVHETDFAGRDARIYFQYRGQRGRSPGGGATQSFSVKMKMGTCEVTNPGLGPLGTPIEWATVRGFIDIVHPDYFAPEQVEFEVNGQTVASCNVPGEQNLQIDLTAGGMNNQLDFYQLPNPYIRIPTGECPTLEGESLVIQRFSLDKNGDFIELATTDDDLADSDFKAPVTRFCEVHEPITVTSGGASGEMTPRQAVTFYNQLGSGEPVRLSSLQDIILVYKAKTEDIRRDCDDRFYDADADRCVDSMMDTIFIEPEVISEEQAIDFVNQFEFEVPGDKTFNYDKSIVDWNMFEGNNGDYSIVSPNPIFMDKHEITTSLKYGGSGCPALPSQSNHQDGTGGFSVNLEDLPDECVKLDVSFAGDSVRINNHVKARLSDNWDVQADISGRDAVSDSGVFKQYTFKMRFTQTTPICRMNDLQIPGSILLNSGGQGTMELGCDLDGTVGYDTSSTTDSAFPGSQSGTEIFSVVSGVNRNVAVALRDDSLLRKSSKVDNFLKVNMGNQNKKFKTGEGQSFEYNVVDSEDQLSDQDKAIMDNASSGGFWSGIWDWILSLFR